MINILTYVVMFKGIIHLVKLPTEGQKKVDPISGIRACTQHVRLALNSGSVSAVSHPQIPFQLFF